MTTPVTLKPKCYVFMCAGCGLLFPPERSDALTCSTRCRVRAYRNGNRRRLRATARLGDVPPGMLLQAEAIERLCPHPMR